MISTEPRFKSDLAARTRLRDFLIWSNLLSGSPVETDEQILNALYMDTGEAFMTVAEEIHQVKEYERDKSVEQAQAEVDQAYYLASAHAEAQRQKIAVKIASDDYLYAAHIYMEQVKAMVMTAKEYAAQIETERVQLEAAAAELAVEKEQVHLQEVEVKVEIEQVQTAMVKADLAKSKLEVARTQVQALLADIEAEKAQIQVIEAEVQIAMAEAEMATLDADVAMIFAEAVTKQLSAYKLQVDQQELSQMGGIIAQKLSDMLQIWAARQSTEAIKTADQATIMQAVRVLASAELDGADIVIDEATMQQEVADSEKQAMEDSLKDIGELYGKESDARIKLYGAESAEKIAIQAARTALEILINGAQASAYSSEHIITKSLHQQFLWIGK